jgi:hypothetical protein
MMAPPLPSLGNGQDLHLQPSINPCLALGVPKSSIMSSQVIGADTDTTPEVAPNAMVLAARALDSDKHGESSIVIFC